MAHRRTVPFDDRPTYLREDSDVGYLLAVDTETDGTSWYDGARPFIATASDYDRDYLYRMEDPQDVRALAMAMMAADGLIFHNAPFDIHMLAAFGVLELEEMLALPVYDTYIIAKVILGEGNMTGSHLGKFGLKELAAHFVDADAILPEMVMKQAMKDMGLITRADQKNLPDGVYHELWKIEPNLVEEYALKDTRYTYDLYMVLLGKMMNEPDEKKRLGHEHAVEINHDAQKELIRMEHRGIALDRKVVDELYDEYTAKLEDLNEQLLESAGQAGMLNFNPNATRDVVALLEAHGVVITEVTDGGYIKTDRKTLEAYEDVPVVKLILDYRRTSKFLSTYLDPMKDRDVVHTSINPLGAWTGRMSSRRPNMQNVPVRTEDSARLRAMFVPRPGYALISADYDRIEPSLLAWYMNDMELMRQFQEEDPYTLMRDMHYGDTPEAERTVGRQEFKNSFLAVNYGVGPNKLATMIKSTVDEAKKIKASIETMLGPAYTNPWYPPLTRDDGSLDWSRGRRYEGLPDGFVQKAKKKIKGKNAVGYVTTIGGSTYRILPGADGKDKSYVAPNTIIQGSAAEVMKLAVALAGPPLRELDAHLLLPVHDELLAEAPIEVADEALTAMQTAMQRAEKLAANGKLRLATTGAVCYTSWAEAK